MSLEEYTATKTVTKTGNGAHVVVLKALLGETVKVVFPADEETGSNSMEETL